jgi:hypothetical protein
MKVVKLLVECGARLDIEDVLWHGTPAGWAEYAGRKGIAAYLREEERKRNQVRTAEGCGKKPPK